MNWEFVSKWRALMPKLDFSDPTLAERMQAIYKQPAIRTGPADPRVAAAEPRLVD